MIEFIYYIASILIQAATLRLLYLYTRYTRNILEGQTQQLDLFRQQTISAENQSKILSEQIKLSAEQFSQTMRPWVHPTRITPAYHNNGFTLHLRNDGKLPATCHIAVLHLYPNEDTPYAASEFNAPIENNTLTIYPGEEAFRHFRLGIYEEQKTIPYTQYMAYVGDIHIDYGLPKFNKDTWEYYYRGDFTLEGMPKNKGNEIYSTFRTTYVT